MSKLNMNKKEWLDLVFEGKNKEYGAYQMRQDDNKTTTKAFFSAIVIITGLAFLPVILSSFGEKPAIVEIKPDEKLKVTDVVFKKVEMKKAEPMAQKAAAKTPVKNPVLKVAAKTEKPDPEVDKTDFTKPSTSTNLGPATGTLPTTGSNIGTVNPEKVPDFPINEPYTPAVLDKYPNFPGGMDEFTKIVGKRFVTPEIEEEKTIKILVYFIVERDGSISNITVPRNPGFNLDVEAIRVLKSIKTKWEPGIFNGKPVRTAYSLPIMIKMQ